jgi:hypothetical protein
MHPVAVHFDLVEPVRPVRCLLDETRELRLYQVGGDDRSFRRAGVVVDAIGL